jgi:hypothetical protein
MPSTTKSVAAPTAGWDTREALADMPEDRAVILDNWFPSTDKVTPRRGYGEHASGMSGEVPSVFPYVSGGTTSKLFAANVDSIYDVSAGGAVGAASVTGFTNVRFQYTQITTSGGTYLHICNGEDVPYLFDGTSWANITYTGPTTANVIWNNTHQRRLWFGERDSLTAWYLAPNAIAGAANQFALGGIAKKGGYIMGMCSWSRDSGDGADDVAIFLTSEGEAIVYQGDDPATTGAWTLIGVYEIGKPIQRRFFCKAGADVVLLTQDGFVFASSILSLDRSQAERVALSQQINKAANDAVKDYSTFFGWQAFIYPLGQMLIFNIPKGMSESNQFVFNTLTKAPCRFTGMNAMCWALFNDNPYFGTYDGRVMRFDNVNADDGTNIEYDALQAFSYFGAKGQKKYFKLAQPIFESGGSPNAAIELCTDFQIKTPTAVPSAQTVSAARWGISRWGIGTWGSDGQIYRGWRGIRGKGFAAALRIRISSNSTRPSWISTDFVYQPSSGKNL